MRRLRTAAAVSSTEPPETKCGTRHDSCVGGARNGIPLEGLAALLPSSTTCERPSILRILALFSDIKLMVRLSAHRIRHTPRSWCGLAGATTARRRRDPTRRPVLVVAEHDVADRMSTTRRMAGEGRVDAWANAIWSLCQSRFSRLRNKRANTRCHISGQATTYWPHVVRSPGSPWLLVKPDQEQGQHTRKQPNEQPLYRFGMLSFA